MSVPEADTDGEYLRCEAISGVYAPYIRRRTPRHYSPCGTALDRNAPQLFSYLARFNFAHYIERLSMDLFQSQAIEVSHISLRTELDEIAFDVDTAIPYGLILNELLTNALKYAFPDGRYGDIPIRLKAEAEHVTLSVRDTGIGFPEGFDFRNTESLGLQLVGMLAEQLGGTLTLTHEGGTTFTVSIPAGTRQM